MIFCTRESSVDNDLYVHFCVVKHFCESDLVVLHGNIIYCKLHCIHIVNSY